MHAHETATTVWLEISDAEAMFFVYEYNNLCE